MSEWRLLGLVRRQLPRIGLAALLAAGAELAGVALIATATWLLATAAQQPPLTALTVAIVGVRAFAVARGLLRYLERLSGHDAVLRAMARLRARVFAAVTPHAPGRTWTRGDLLTRLVSDVDEMQDLLLRVGMPLWNAVVVSLLVCGFSWIFSPLAAGGLATGLAVAGVSGWLLSARMAAASARHTASRRADLAAAAVDVRYGAADLAAAGATDWASQRAGAAADELAAAERRGGAIAAAVGAIPTAISGVTVAVIVLTAGDLGVMTAVLSLAGLVSFEALQPIPGAAQRWTRTRAAAVRLTELLDRPVPVPDPKEPLPLPDDVRLTLHRLRPEIPGREHGGVDLDLPPGRRVALLGASGAGKSMLLATLLRFAPIASGNATLGGTDLTRLRGDDIRTRVAGMMSEAYLFSSSVAENLRVAAPEADDARLCGALTRAGLSELALDTDPGENGGRLSGGQRQRVLLARALLADPAILVLDEPTEHLDPDTADAVLRDIWRATAGRSLILVTHRLTGLEQCDEILLLDDGAVRQRGTHDELITQDGPYREWAGTFMPEGSTI